MFLLVLFLICTFMSLFVGGLAAWSDIRGMTIPNSHSALIGLLFLIAFLLLAIGHQDQVFEPIWKHFLAALIVFGITALLFAAKALGAADSKLATVFALWVGLHALPSMLFYMTLVGGLLGLAALGIKRLKLFPQAPAGSWPAQVQAGENKVPYGVAITIGAAVAFLQAGYIDPATLSNFIAAKP